jgi:hypothetical protein
MSIQIKEAGLSGDLKTVSLADLLQLISTSGKTGMLSVSRPKGSVPGEVQKREIYFLKGNITYATSFGSEDELLGKLILRKRKISKADLGKAVSLQKVSNKRLGGVLFEMGLLSRDEVGEFLRYQIEEIIYNLFGWTSGEFTFSEEKLPSSDQITTHINTQNMVMEGTRRIDEWYQIQKSLPGDDLCLRVSADPKIKSSELSLSLDDVQTLLLINGERTIPEILELSGMGEFLTSKAIYNLLTLGLVEEGEKRKLQRSQREEEELLLEMVIGLYALSYQMIEKLVSQKLGEGAKRILSDSLHLQKTYHPILDSLVSSENFLNIGNLRNSLGRVPERIRFHRLVNGMNALLMEFLRSVSLTLGQNLTRQIIAQIKRESAQITSQEREIAKKYELEEELFRTLKQAL